MNPDTTYKASDLGTVDNPRPKGKQPSEAASGEPVFSAPSEGEENIVYDLEQLSNKRPGPVLAVGYGNGLKSAVRAASNFGVNPLYSTGTDDKLRAFSFGGASNSISIGKKLDPRLFTNPYSILDACDRSEARTILWANDSKPDPLIQRECARRDILIMSPMQDDRTRQYWTRAMGEFTPENSADVEEPTWRRCAKCGLFHDVGTLKANAWKCPDCDALTRLNTDERMDLTFDEGSVEEWFQDVDETNPLDFPEFDAIIDKARKKSGKDEGVRVGSARIQGIPVAFAVMEPDFIMGSMGSVVGERITAMFERATELGLPVVTFSTSGGARMQEGLASLMQMAKTAAAVQAHSDAGLLYISVLADPTTGGVTASFATLGDINLSEPGAVIGFAGRRVIQDTIKQTLPEDFQTAEFALEHGLIDAIIERSDMRRTLAQLLRLHSYETAAEPVHEKAKGSMSQTSSSSIEEEDEPVTPPNALQGIFDGIASFGQSIGHVLTEQTENASLWWKSKTQGVADYPNIRPAGPGSAEESNHAWQSVQLARNTKRPTSEYYIASLFDDFIELHGDRESTDDGAIVGGLATIAGRPVTIISQEKGPNLKERIKRNFGCPQPEGYRKSARLMKEAEKFGRPIVCLIDTQGAFCGSEAEEHGIGNAIAENLALMSSLEVPIVSVVIGEAGSGGALAIAVSNTVAMQENAVYSVLSPEGFASIIWKDGSRAPEAAEVMKMSAADALEMGIVDAVISEGTNPSHENPDQAAAALWLFITQALNELDSKSPEELKSQRYERFRKF